MQQQTVATVVLLCLHLLLRVSRLLSRSARAVMRLTDAPGLTLCRWPATGTEFHRENMCPLQEFRQLWWQICYPFVILTGFTGIFRRFHDRLSFIYEIFNRQNRTIILNHEAIEASFSNTRLFCARTYTQTTQITPRSPRSETCWPCSLVETKIAKVSYLKSRVTLKWREAN